MAASPTFYWGCLIFFTVVFAVFYAIAYSVVFGIVQNYQRYYQKADLQWTGPAGLEKRTTRSPVRLLILVLLAIATSWFVVNFVIFR